MREHYLSVVEMNDSEGKLIRPCKDTNEMATLIDSFSSYSSFFSLFFLSFFSSLPLYFLFHRSFAFRPIDDLLFRLVL